MRRAGARPQIELLAPARDLDGGLAALDHGADAVYVGAPAFGARRAASNSLADVARLVERAHRYWARVYVTLNTLLRDAELGAAAELARGLAELGVDGLIVQDLAFLELPLPPELILVASTQLDCRDPARVRFLEAVGVSRAILARELSLAEIGAVREAAPHIELECFVHGALCVSYSGQCWMSYAGGGRSGNRGDCAQPCRKPYTLVDAAGRRLVERQHLLSLRDLDLSDHLGALLDVGVTAFKIEGRLKDRAYVATAVAHYRRRLDPLLAARGLERSSSGYAPVAFDPDPARVFHRGSTTHFLLGRPAAQATLRSPKSIGPLVGAVTAQRGRRLEVALAPGVTLRAGDGLAWFDLGGALQGAAVSRVAGAEVELGTPARVPAGTALHRNLDHAYRAAVERSHPRRAIAVSIALTPAGPGELRVSAVDADGVEAAATLTGPFATARDPAAARAAVTRQLARTGDTEFGAVEVDPGDGTRHLSLSTLNALRRSLLAELRAARARARPRRRRPAPAEPPPRWPAAPLDYRANVLNDVAARFLARHGAVVAERAAESGVDLAGRVVMTTRYCLLHELGGCPATGGAPPGTLPYTLLDDEGRRLELVIDCARCQMEVRLPARPRKPRRRPVTRT